MKLKGSKVKEWVIDDFFIIKIVQVQVILGS